MEYKYLINKGEKVNFDKVWKFIKNYQTDEIEVKAVVLEDALFVAKGKIVVAKGIRGVEAFLRFKVLLVGENARAQVIPELEILSNDVKAFHAASIGRIDTEQMFYLMSRGMTKSEAEKLIIKAFLL